MPLLITCAGTATLGIASESVQAHLTRTWRSTVKHTRDIIEFFADIFANAFELAHTR